METHTPSILRELVFIIFDRFKLIVFIFASIFLLFFLYALLSPNIYQATTTFTLNVPQSLDPLQQETTWDYEGRASRIMQTQQELIFSNRVLEHVVYQFYPDTTSKNYVDVLNQIREKLRVSSPEGQTFAESNTFHIVYTDLEPDRTAEITSFITNIYMM